MLKHPDVAVVSAAVVLSTKRLGYAHLRPEQQKAYVSFLMGNDVFVNLPMESRKSLCYAVLPIAYGCT